MLPSGKNLSFASATRRVVANPECVPASRFCGGLRKAVPRLLVVDTFEDKIVAEDEPIARVRRAGESALNRGHGDVHCDFRGRGDLHFDFHAWHFSSTADLGLSVSTDSCRFVETDDEQLVATSVRRVR